MMREIPISRGLLAIVSDEDFEALSIYKWYAKPNKSGSYYVCRGGRSSEPANVYMHREILSPENGMVVDHINGDGLDNTRQNLRVVSYSENAARKTYYSPKTGFRGVRTHRRKWCADIWVFGKRKYLGLFSSAEDAARAYDAAAFAAYGDCAVLNFGGL